MSSNRSISPWPSHLKDQRHYLRHCSTVSPPPSLIPSPKLHRQSPATKNSLMLHRLVSANKFPIGGRPRSHYPIAGGPTGCSIFTSQCHSDATCASHLRLICHLCSSVVNPKSRPSPIDGRPPVDGHPFVSPPSTTDARRLLFVLGSCPPNPSQSSASYITPLVPVASSSLTVVSSTLSQASSALVCSMLHCHNPHPTLPSQVAYPLPTLQTPVAVTTNAVAPPSCAPACSCHHLTSR